MLKRVESFYILYSTLLICGWLCRTKWKRQTAVGLELLAEAGNYAAVQRMLQTNPYWATYDPHTVSLIANLDTILLRHQASPTVCSGASSLGSPASVHPLPVPAVAARMLMHQQQQQQQVTAPAVTGGRVPSCSPAFNPAVAARPDSPRVQAIV